MKHGQLLKRMEWVHTHIPFNEIRTDNFIQGQIVAGSDVSSRKISVVQNVAQVQ